MATKYFDGKIFLGKNNFTDHIYVSDLGEVIREQDYLLSSTQNEVSLKGALMLPAFRDGHAHPLFAGREAKGLNISDCKSEEDLLSALAEYSSERPDAVWIDGAVFDRSMPAFFHRATLDRAVSEVPVVLHGDDHHTLWVNTKALEAAGILGPSTPNLGTPGIDVDAQGVPTGILREWPAMRLVLDLEPKQTLESDVKNLLNADYKLAAAGIVECYDGWIDRDMAETFMAAADSGQLKLDYKLCFRADPETFNQDLPYIRQMREQTNLREQLDGKAIKFFIDGVFGSATAMVEAPYLTTDSHGSPVWDELQLRAAIALANNETFQIHIHAIGDAALSLALDILEEIPRGSLAYRPVLIHIELTSEALIHRITALNAIACVQPYWAQPNGMLNSCRNHLGDERLERLYAFNQMLELGASMAFSSDWPVSSHEPLKGIAVAVNRRETENQNPHNLDQAITLQQAIEAYTTGVQAMRQDLQPKQFEVGSIFNAIALDKDIFNLPVMEISSASITATYKAGTKIF